LAALHALGALALGGRATAQELDEPRFTRCVMTNYQIAQGLPARKLTPADVRRVSTSATLPLEADLVLEAPGGFELSHVKNDAPVVIGKSVDEQRREGRVVKVVLRKADVQQKSDNGAHVTLSAVVSRIVPDDKAQEIVRSCIDEQKPAP
jgi:hypothetical protein